MAGTKTRTLDDPYAIFVAGSWEWRVLKRYQNPENESANPYAAWFCAVRSPLTYGSWDYGDTYIADIPGAYAGYAFPESGAVRKESGTTITTATLYPSR
jgi:hypothetical protein